MRGPCTSVLLGKGLFPPLPKEAACRLSLLDGRSGLDDWESSGPSLRKPLK